MTTATFELCRNAFMEKTEATASPQATASRGPRSRSARPDAGDALSSRRPLPNEDHFAGVRLRAEPGAAMIAPVAAAMVIAWAASPAITFVLLRSKGYGLISASLGVAAGALGLLLAIAAPSHRPVG